MKAQIYFILLVFTSMAAAQLDPSTKVLVRKGASVEVEAEEIDTSRYEVRTVQVPVQQAPQQKKVIKRVIVPADGAVAQTSSTAAAAAGNATAKTTATAAAAAGAEVEVREVVRVAPKKVIVKEEVVVAKPQVEEVKLVRVESQPVPLSQQLQIFLLGDPNEINAFRQELHPMDSKNNKIELALAPYLFYNNSQSSYWYRNYNFNSLGIAGDLRGWFTPFFGLHIAYQSSLGGYMPGNPTATVNASVVYQTLEAGLRFRKYFGSYRKAPWMSYGIDWQDQKISTSGDGNERMTINTAGLNLSAEANLPSTLSYAQTFSFSFVPRPWESETQPQGITSGNSPEVYKVNFGYGGLYQMDRYHQLFWRLQQSYQKSIYKGTASAPDPVSGLTPSKVTVTESATFLYFGIQFGQ